MKYPTVFAGLLSLAIAPFSAGSLLKTYDFETGDLSRVDSTELEYQTASVAVSSAFARRGKYSMKAYIEKADKRAEAVCQLRGTIGGENWYGWSIYVPADQPDDGKFDIISQFHDWHSAQPAWAKDGTAPTNVTLGDDGMLRFSLKYQGPVDPLTGNPTTVHQLFDLAPATKGAWHDFVVHAKWTHLADGYVQVWLNGELKVDYAGPTYLDYGAGNGPYFKMGDYKGVTNWPGTGPRYFYMDEFRMGGADCSYDEVNPAQTSQPVYEGFNYTQGDISGAAGGTGWSSSWTVSGGAGFNYTLTGGFTYTGLTTTGNRFMIFDKDGNLQTVTRGLAAAVGEVPGTYWISFMSKKNAAGRESYIRFGDLVFAALTSEWQVKTPGTGYVTLPGAGYAATHLFLARVDAGAFGDTVRVWVDPVLTQGEPAAASALVTITDTPFSFNNVSIQYGPLGKSTQSGEWDEIRVGRSFYEAIGAVDIPTAADVALRAGSYANTNYRSDTTLMANNSTTASYVREIYLRFDLAQYYQGTPGSAKLVLTPVDLGTDVTNAAFEVRLVSDDTWQERTITWNNRPAEGVLLTTISGANLHVGVPIEIDLTAAATQELAGDGKLSLAIIATSAANQRFATFGSFEGGANQPLMRLK